MLRPLVSGLLLCIAVGLGLAPVRVQAQLLTLDVALTDNLSIEMVWIPPGRFDMGTTQEKELTFSGDLTFPNERPVHTVTLTRGFYMAATN